MKNLPAGHRMFRTDDGKLYGDDGQCQFPIFEDRESHLDAGENYFFSRELEYISREQHMVEYAQGLTRKLLPINAEIPKAMQSFTWRQWDQTGAARRISDDASDLPQAGVLGSENNQILQSYGLGYSYSEDEIAAAALLQRPLDRDRAQAVRDGIERQLNDVAADGDSDGTLVGFMTLANTNTYTPSTKASGSSVGTTSWLDSSGNLVATPAEVLNDVNTALRKVFDDSKEIEKATRVVLPTRQMTVISQTARSDNSDTTILQFLKDNNPGVEFMSWERLKARGSANTDRMVAYDPRKEKLELLLPIEFEQQAPQLRNYRFKINCRMKCGGVIAYRPKSILFADGI